MLKAKSQQIWSKKLVQQINAKNDTQTIQVKTHLMPRKVDQWTKQNKLLV